MAMVKAANVAFISKSTPGSWPEEEKIWLVLGVDFEMDFWYKNEILIWYHEATEHEVDEECECEEWIRFRQECLELLNKFGP